MTKILWFVLSFTLVGCAASTAVRTTRDDFERATINTMYVRPNLEPESIFSTHTSLNLRRVLTDSGQCRYDVDLMWFGKVWLFIADGESLILLIDGRRVGLSGEGSIGRRDVLTADLLEEQASYPVSFDILKEIAAAKSVRLKIVGTTSYDEKYLEPKHLEAFRDFVRQFAPSENTRTTVK